MQINLNQNSLDGYIVFKDKKLNTLEYYEFVY